MRLLALAALVLAACNSTKATIEEPTEGAPTPSVVAPEVAAPGAAAPAATAAPSPAGELTLVTTPSQVCMVNNQFMGREQIPVQVDGKTYFGCCEMCQGRLNSDPSARLAKDPVSGKAVDKASAVIARRASGDVVYFENAANFERYRQL